jgi:hypothetical protein
MKGYIGKEGRELPAIEKLGEEKIFLEWVNNWLTVGRMAEYYGVDEVWLTDKIIEGRNIHNKNAEK